MGYPFPILQFFGNEIVDASLIAGLDGSYVDGDWQYVYDVPADVRIIAPQPLTSNDLQLVEDGEHVRDYLVSWSETKVFTREGNRNADLVVWDGSIYKVMQTDDRTELGPYYRFVMHKQDPGWLS
jgi:hypothetical protein